MSDAVRIDIENHVALLTLNRAEARNPISDPEVVEALLDALATIEADADVRVAILTGAGIAFSAGGNIKKMGKPGGLYDELPAQTRRNYKYGIQKLPLAFEALDVPVIAAVNGAAIGAGCDLACMCDIRICSDSAVFAESFVKLGIVPGDGGAWLLPRIVGFSNACEMALTGDAIDAARALEFRLVSSVFPQDQLLDAARVLASRIVANPPHAVRMTKRLLREAQSMSLSATLEMSAAMQALAHATSDHAEAVAAFREKRPAKLSGR